MYEDKSFVVFLNYFILIIFSFVFLNSDFFEPLESDLRPSVVA